MGVALEADPDIAAERRVLEAGRESTIVAQARLPGAITNPVRAIPLNVKNRAHQANAKTRDLVQAAGGLPALRRFTEMFYQKAFADPLLDKFIRSHDDPHGER